MSGVFGRVFGKSKEQSQASALASIDKLSETLEMLEKKENLLIKKANLEVEKAKGSTKAKNKRAAFVALMFSGALSSSNSSFNSMDGLRPAGGYTSSPLGALRPKMTPSGSRSLHTSRPLSAPVANRPLSPHLPLKKPQLSATFSISHRIFGAALAAAIISIPLATKFSLMFDV